MCVVVIHLILFLPTPVLRHDRNEILGGFFHIITSELLFGMLHRPVILHSQTALRKVKGMHSNSSVPCRKQQK